MKDKVKIELNREGVRAILKSQMMMDAITDVALKKGDLETSFVGFDRVQVIVEDKNNAD